MKPSDIDLTSKLLGVLGWVEYEHMAIDIVRYLVQSGDNWDEVFQIADIPEAVKRPTIFAMFCASGWVDAHWYPSGFTVDEGFVERLSGQ